MAIAYYDGSLSEAEIRDLFSASYHEGVCASLKYWKVYFGFFFSVVTCVIRHGLRAAAEP